MRQQCRVCAVLLADREAPLLEVKFDSDEGSKKVQAICYILMDESNDKSSETRSVKSMTNFTLEEPMNIFTMQLNNALKVFDTFSPEFIQLFFLFALQTAEAIELTMTTFR